jgi:hypothetical protein
MNPVYPDTARLVKIVRYKLGSSHGRGGGVSEIYLWLKWAHVVSSTVLFGMGA